MDLESSEEHNSSHFICNVPIQSEPTNRCVQLLPNYTVTPTILRMCVWLGQITNGFHFSIAKTVAKMLALQEDAGMNGKGRPGLGTFTSWSKPLQTRPEGTVQSPQEEVRAYSTQESTEQGTQTTIL